MSNVKSDRAVSVSGTINGIKMTNLGKCVDLALRSVLISCNGCAYLGVAPARRSELLKW